MDPGAKFNTTKMHKVKYQVNLLPFLGSYFEKENGRNGKVNNNMTNTNSDLMNQFANSEEMEIYDTTSLNQFLDFKWDSHA